MALRIREIVFELALDVYERWQSNLVVTLLWFIESESVVDWDHDRYDVKFERLRGSLTVN